MANLDSLQNIIGLILSVSVASERLVEIIKGLIPFLNEANDDPVREGRRRSALQGMAVLAGIFTAFLASPILTPVLYKSSSGFPENLPGLLAIGLLASGGSGLWNTLLSYVLLVKDIKKQEVTAAQVNIDEEIDSCSVEAVDITSDEDLPAAEGGVVIA